MTKDYLIEKNGKKYEVVIGLEVHAQVLSVSKLFSTEILLLKISFNNFIKIYLYFPIKEVSLKLQREN